MYITNPEELRNKVSEALDKVEEIERKRDEWIFQQYGIEDFSLIVSKFFSSMKDSEHISVGLLARQLPGICMEDIAFTLSCDLLGLQPLSMSFVRDVFVENNHDKMARARVPWVKWSKKGNMVVEYEYVTKLKPNLLNRVPISMIETVCNRALPELHTDWRETVFAGKGGVPDISLFWNQLLLASSKKPEKVFVLKDGREVSVPILEALFHPKLLGEIRPPSHWYYPIYLSLFLTGEIILFETYENPNGGVPEAKILFEKAMMEVKTGTGFLPLVVEIPPLTPSLLQCNRGVLEKPELLKEIDLSAINRDSTVSLVNQIADLVQKLR